ncbi:twin-arginine translocase TatA/TatE family subunit [Novosphingobium sp. ZN18A2]|uniref:twin-arginine translocase TatA/TatE family subunit n=1 Tax=Novosphingobium sp. ZN18A2 TaxID=3079861 RepID=UPI0030CCD956
MQAGPWQLIIIALVVLVLFGRGRISEMMGDFGKGIKSFKQGLNEEDQRTSAPQAPPAQISPPPSAAPAASQTEQPSLNGEPVSKDQKAGGN